MTEKKFTVKELVYYLLDLIENGHSEKTVKVSVNYDHCDHIQKLSKVYPNEGLDWITLVGGKE